MSGWRRLVGPAVLALLAGAGVAVLSVGGTARARSRAAHARRPARISAGHYGVHIQAVFSAAGNPLLVANFTPDGSLARVRWSICSPPPASTCVSARSDHGGLNPGPRRSGTVFWAAAHYRGHRYVAHLTWYGRVAAVSRPSLLGRPQDGQRVRPIRARWRGGWGGEFDQLGVEACRTRSARQCVMVSGGQLGCPDHSRAVVRSALRGRYLFALVARMPADEICAGVAYGSESDIPVWPIGQTVARSAPRGPVGWPLALAVPGLRPSQLRGIALRFARGAGDPHPGRVEAVRTTYEEALKLVYGTLPPGVSDPTKSVYEITMTGHFTGYGASVPPGASLPTGTEQTVIVDRYGNTSDAWLNNRPEPALAQAGPVIKLFAKTFEQASAAGARRSFRAVRLGPVSS